MFIPLLILILLRVSIFSLYYCSKIIGHIIGYELSFIACVCLFSFVDVVLNIFGYLVLILCCKVDRCRRTGTTKTKALYLSLESFSWSQHLIINLILCVFELQIVRTLSKFTVVARFHNKPGKLCFWIAILSYLNCNCNIKSEIETISVVKMDRGPKIW